MKYYGVSYGTAIGAVYETKFRNVEFHGVLDSSVNPDWVWFKQFSSQMTARSERLDELFQSLAKQNKIYHLGASAEEVMASWRAVVRKEGGADNLPYPPSLLWQGRILNIQDRLARLFGQHDSGDAAKSSTLSLTTDVLAAPALWPQFADYLARRASPNIVSPAAISDAANEPPPELPIASDPHELVVTHNPDRIVGGRSDKMVTFGDSRTNSSIGNANQRGAAAYLAWLEVQMKKNPDAIVRFDFVEPDDPETPSTTPPGGTDD